MEEMQERLGVRSAADSERLSLGEACEALGLPPSTFRQVLAEFEDLVDDGSDDDGAVATLSPLMMTRLRAIVAWRNEGLPAAEIRARLQVGESEAGAAVETAPPSAEDLLAKQMEGLQRALERSEERRMEDRDRLLTALMRTQQEIQTLRYSIAATSSRRDRKGRGLFGRLFS